MNPYILLVVGALIVYLLISGRMKRLTSAITG